MKRVYLEPAWKTHSFYQGLMANPPPGYEFVTLKSSQEKVFRAASKTNLAYALFNVVDKFIPVNLAKSRLERLRRIPPGTDLTYAYDHLVFRKEPWVVDFEYAALLVSYNVNNFRRYKRVVERALGSQYCRTIICATEAARRTVLLNLDCTQFADKLEIVPFAVRPKSFVKNLDNKDRVKLLFVGSANIVGEFDTKGGREALEAFVLLNKKYDNLEFVVRSDIPRGIKGKYKGLANLKLIEDRISWEELEHEFQSADIFLLPVHNTPFSAFLDAMSYELPIVTIDSWANPEIVADGRTGLLAHKSEKIPYYVESSMPAFGTHQFRQAIKAPDPKVVGGLVDKAGLLIENAELRRNLGKAGRWEVEYGRFSIEQRNAKLKRIFDEATG